MRAKQATQYQGLAERLEQLERARQQRRKLQSAGYSFDAIAAGCNVSTTALRSVLGINGSQPKAILKAGVEKT